jgi:hypothetical protein
MNDPLEDQLRSTFRQVAQQTTTSHDLGVPPPAPRPSHSRRLMATAALSVLALVGGGAFLATRDDGGPQTVVAAGDDTATDPETTPSLGAALANMCTATRPPSAMQEMIDKVCAGGNLASANPLAACGIDLSSIRDLLAPVMTDVGPQLEQLKALFAEFEPRIRAITDDPATKAKLEAAGDLLRERLEGLADPATRPDLSDPAARQKLFDDLKGDLEPLASDTALRDKVEALANELYERLEALANTPEVQALREKVEGLSQSDQAKDLAEKLKACFPK